MATSSLERVKRESIGRTQAILRWRYVSSRGSALMKDNTELTEYYLINYYKVTVTYAQVVPCRVNDEMR